MEVAKLLPRNGPSGTYSQACMSRADQSLRTTTPKTCSRKRSTGTGSPSVEPTPTTQPSSASMSSFAARPELRRRVARGLDLAVRPGHVGAGDHHRAGPAVVADRHVLPVRGQRRAVRPEHPADVAGVVLRGVEVDVVGDLERQVQLTSSSGIRCGSIASGRVSSRCRALRVDAQASGPRAMNALRLGWAKSAGSTSPPWSAAPDVEHPLADRDPDPRVAVRAGRRPRTAARR